MRTLFAPFALAHRMGVKQGKFGDSVEALQGLL